MICSAFRLARFNAKRRRRNGAWSFFHRITYNALRWDGCTACHSESFYTNKIWNRHSHDTLTIYYFCAWHIHGQQNPIFNITSKIGIKQGILPMVLEFSAAILFFVITPELALSAALSIYLIICAMYGVVKGKQLEKGYSTT